MTPTIYLPIEIRGRELQSRLELAKLLVKRGCQVVLGQQWSLFQNAHNIPKGIILFKTCNAIQAKNMANFKSAGHVVVAMDDEVLPCSDARGYLIAFHENAAANMDYFLAQSIEHAEAVCESDKLKDAKCTVYTVGNPRIDICRGDTFKAEGERLKAEYGPFILINTNYGVVNSIWGSVKQALHIAAQAGVVTDHKTYQEFMDCAAWEERNKQEMLKFVKLTQQEYGNLRVVIRPHPGEKPDLWTKLESPTLKVMTGTDPLPWIWAAEKVVHTSSTTGLEAALMGKMTINIRPERHPLFSYITGTINTVVESAEEAVKILPYSDGNFAAEIKAGTQAMYPSGANEAIARTLLAHAPQNSGKWSFEHKERTSIQKTKCTLTHADVKDFNRVTQLDDSLWLLDAEKEMTPTPKLAVFSGELTA